MFCYKDEFYFDWYDRNEGNNKENLGDWVTSNYTLSLENMGVFSLVWSLDEEKPLEMRKCFLDIKSKVSLSEKNIDFITMGLKAIFFKFEGMGFKIGKEKRKGKAKLFLN